jgi:hypothetical protein
MYDALHFFKFIFCGRWLSGRNIISYNKRCFVFYYRASGLLHFEKKRWLKYKKKVESFEKRRLKGTKIFLNFSISANFFSQNAEACYPCNRIQNIFYCMK